MQRVRTNILPLLMVSVFLVSAVIVIQAQLRGARELSNEDLQAHFPGELLPPGFREVDVATGSPPTFYGPFEGTHYSARFQDGTRTVGITILEDWKSLFWFPSFCRYVGAGTYESCPLKESAPYLFSVEPGPCMRLDGSEAACHISYPTFYSSADEGETLFASGPSGQELDIALPVLQEISERIRDLD